MESVVRRLCQTLVLLGVLSRVVSSEINPMGYAGRSREAAPCPRCPRKAKLREPQTCSLCCSLRKGLNLWFWKSFLRTTVLPRNPNGWGRIPKLEPLPGERGICSRVASLSEWKPHPGSRAFSYLEGNWGWRRKRSSSLCLKHTSGFQK